MNITMLSLHSALCDSEVCVCVGGGWGDVMLPLSD